MKCIKTGNKNDTQPRPAEGECILVDMWGDWILYKREYTSGIEKYIERFVEDRKYDVNYFNSNYIKKVVIK